MRTLLISCFFPPGNTIGAVRVGKTAKHLLGMGHEVRVVCADPTTLSQGDSSLPLEIPAEMLCCVPWVDPHQWARPLVRRLAAPRSTGEPSSKNTAPKSSPPAASFVNSLEGLPKPLRGLAKLYLSWVNLPDSFKRWRRPAVMAAVDLIRRWPADVIYASGPPFTALQVAADVSRITGTPWVAELRDLWKDDPHNLYGPWRRALDGRFERRTLSTADGMVTVSAPLARVLEDRYHKPVEVVLNGFDHGDHPQPSTEQYDQRLHIVYTGKICGLKRDPTPLYEALKLLGKQAEHIDVSFYVLDDMVMAERTVEQHGLEHIVHIHPPVPYQRSLALQADADLLLLIIWDTAGAEGIFTGKLFEYLGAKRPVLAIAPKNNVARELINRDRLGLATNDPAEIARWLAGCIELKQRGGLPGLDDAAVEPYSRRAQTRVLADFLQRIVPA